MNIEIRELRPEDAPDAARVHQAMMELDDWDFLLSEYRQDEEFCTYLDRVAAYKSAESVPAGKVTSTFLVAVIDGKIAGRLSIGMSSMIFSPLLADILAMESRRNFEVEELRHTS
jgi:predicted acetyltransferase